jgi:GTP pyrophosphokinase
LDYKQQAGRIDGRQYRWLREMLDILEQASNPEEFLEHTKLEMFQDQVFAFTPKGDLIALPRGATPVDFAYAVHSQIGDTCVGAKINGRLLPLRTQLANGDQVEIVTSRAQTPSPTWERFVVTGKARARIRRFVRTQQRAQYLDLGRAIVQKAFRQQGQDFSERPLEAVLGRFSCAAVEDLYVAVGEGIAPAARSSTPPSRSRPRTRTRSCPITRRSRKGHQHEAAVPIRGLDTGDGAALSPVAAIRCRATASSASSRPARGVTIHTIDCDTLGSFADEPKRLARRRLEQRRGDLRIPGRINVTIANEPGNLGSLTRRSASRAAISAT